MFSPLLRNGNMLMVHSVESFRKMKSEWASTEYDEQKVMEMLTDFAGKVIEESRVAETEDERIKAVLVTDLHSIDVSDRIQFQKRFKPHQYNAYSNLRDSRVSHYILAMEDGINPEIDLVEGDVTYSYVAEREAWYREEGEDVDIATAKAVMHTIDTKKDNNRPWRDPEWYQEIVDFKYSDDWYIAVLKTGETITEFLDTGKEEYMQVMEEAHSEEKVMEATDDDDMLH